MADIFGGVHAKRLRESGRIKDMKQDREVGARIAQQRTASKTPEADWRSLLKKEASDG